MYNYTSTLRFCGDDFITYQNNNAKCTGTISANQILSGVVTASSGKYGRPCAPNSVLTKTGAVYTTYELIYDRDDNRRY